MTQYLNNLPLGATIDVRGPSGKVVYNGDGQFTIRADKKAEPQTVWVNKVSMIAGGSGITLMLQISNQTEEDILLREELEDIEKEHPDRLKLRYTVDRPPAEWKYGLGFIHDKMIREHLFPPSSDNIVHMCGPPPMINFACTPALGKLNYDSKRRFAY